TRAVWLSCFSLGRDSAAVNRGEAIGPGLYGAGVRADRAAGRRPRSPGAAGLAGTRAADARLYPAARGSTGPGSAVPALLRRASFPRASARDVQHPTQMPGTATF